MKTKNFGDIQLSNIGLGTGIGDFRHQEINYKKMLNIVSTAIDLGVSLIDTAPVYGHGESESIIGRAIQKKRNDVFIATKLNPQDSAYENVIKSCQSSLKRLRTDRIDLLQVHWPNPKIPLEETLSAMVKLIKDGCIRKVGVSNFSINEVKQSVEILGEIPLSSIQVEYNLFDRLIEQDLLPYCKKNNISILAYSPLHRGKLANGAKAIGLIEKIAQSKNKSSHQIVLSWLAHHKNVFPIPNTTKEKNLLSIIDASNITLSKEEIELISNHCRPNIQEVPIDQIEVSSISPRKVYTTLKQAKDNLLNLTPSPLELSEEIRSGQFLKPVRVSINPNDPEKYMLMEGRLRYWAWVLAFKGKKPIPVLLDESHEY